MSPASFAHRAIVAAKAGSWLSVSPALPLRRDTTCRQRSRWSVTISKSLWITYTASTNGLSGRFLGISNTVAVVPSIGSVFFLAPCSNRFLVTFSSIAWVWAVVSRDVHQNRGRMLVRVITRLRDRHRQLAAVNIRQIVQGDAESDAVGAQLILDLVPQVLDERLHHRIVDQLAELCLVPLGSQQLDVGDRQVPFRGARQQIFTRWRSGRGDGKKTDSDQEHPTAELRHESISLAGGEYPSTAIALPTRSGDSGALLIGIPTNEQDDLTARPRQLT